MFVVPSGTSAFSPSASRTACAAHAALSRGFTNYSTRNVLGALRNMAKGLAQVPGRKTLVFLSAGFTVPTDSLSELTAAIDACNHANVAIYPIDVRGPHESWRQCPT